MECGSRHGSANCSFALHLQELRMLKTIEMLIRLDFLYTQDIREQGRL